MKMLKTKECLDKGNEEHMDPSKNEQEKAIVVNPLTPFSLFHSEERRNETGC